MKFSLRPDSDFPQRHIGPSEKDQAFMLQAMGLNSLEELAQRVIPADIRLAKDMDLPAAIGEDELQELMAKLAADNQPMRSLVGMGYYGTLTPAVLQRNILENPGWYTAYTPYQAEIAQGRLEALINYQTMVSELTGMELANASLLDEATAAAEAMHMFWALRKGPRKKANTFFVDIETFPQVRAVLQTRADSAGIDLLIAPLSELDLTSEELFGVYLQYPNDSGLAIDHKALVASAQDQGVFTAFGSDLLALCLLTPPGEWGADVVVGSSQRFGVPLGNGGPHAAFFATKEAFKRHIPGRLIGASKDRMGQPAYRMALQTREQHIRREKATSNICTAQVLLAVMAGMYGVYHGPEGLRNIAGRVAGLTQSLAEGLESLGLPIAQGHRFDTVKVLHQDPKKWLQAAEQEGFNLREYPEGGVGISLDQLSSPVEVGRLLRLAKQVSGHELRSDRIGHEVELTLPKGLARTSGYMGHPVFNSFQSEHEMLRYLKRLENKDLSLTHSMIPLGSCTMKLNATSEMMPISLPGFNNIHPFAPAHQRQGYRRMEEQLKLWLNEITGFAATSLQPNSGAQGEYAGLMTIRAFHQAQGQGHRKVALIPTSAHGTNPASAVMAGMKVVVVAADERGNVDLDDLKSKAAAHADELAALMVTYPSTHGVFEEAIREVCGVVHQHGGLVYMDGANMNAQVGLTSPAAIGADVCHLNLHKTFCIPHGGGGPGMGPICCTDQLAPHLPGEPQAGPAGQGSVSAAPSGSASILPISYSYIAMMGGKGLKQATLVAMLNANYIRHRLADAYPVLYVGEKGMVAHEFIIDCRPFKAFDIEVEDIAKRLMDYGFHAPTVSFPVAGTMMIEPTESEGLSELDRFCEAMLAIREEIAQVESGKVDKENNPVKNAPHTALEVMGDTWDKPYSREQAAYPLPWVRQAKFWPSVARIDSALGDRQLMCSCLPMEAYAEESQEA